LCGVIRQEVAAHGIKRKVAVDGPDGVSDAVIRFDRGCDAFGCCLELRLEQLLEGRSEIVTSEDLKRG
jgi:hypothetical protein